MFSRRKFITTTAALGTAKALSASSAKIEYGFAKAVVSPASNRRQSPDRSIKLESKSLTVELDAFDGLPFRYVFGDETIWGEDTGVPIHATICVLAPRRYLTFAVHPTSAKQSPNGVVFNFEATAENRICAQFSLIYEIEAASLVVTLGDVVEHDRFELIEVALPNLGTVREGDDRAWMAQGRNGGSFVHIAESKAYRFADDEYFGRIGIQLPIGMVGSGTIGCLMEVSAFMDATETAVVLQDGSRSAQIGTIQVYRVHGGRCYNMNDGGPPVCGNQHTPNLLVGQTPRCRFDFFHVTDAATPWFPGAKIFRNRMPLTPTKYFDDKFLFMIAGKDKVEAAPRTTFAQSGRLIRDISRLTDYAPLVAYISGWVYDGQDTGYPSEDKVNASLGTYDELLQLMHDHRSQNVNVSVNVNYDDAYKSSPEFNTDFIAREPNGNIWKSRSWDGEDSYIVGMAKYVGGGWAKRRIDAMMARYKLSDAMLIDALSWFTIRNDWDPKHPASGYKNLVDGKWVIIEEFRKRGVHVSSEQFRYPMLGKLALSVDGPEPAPCLFGGRQIPLTSIVYRKSTIFGSAGGSKLRPQHDLFWNNRPGMWYENKTDRKAITDYYYLVVLPFNKIHALDVVSYSEQGTIREIGLEGTTRVKIDTSSSSYRITHDGATIACDGTTTCRVDADRIAFYSRDGGRLTYPMPQQWVSSQITARSLTLDGRELFPVKVEAGEIVIDAPARSPVMVYSKKDRILSPELPSA